MDLEFVDTHFRIRTSVITNPDTCAGCRTCEVICALHHEGAVDLERARIRVDRKPFEGLFKPRVCHQCSHPHCMFACPVDAISIRTSDGAVVVDDQTCTGCGTCEEACPFGMITLDPSKEVAFKCDLCGGDPQCAKWCPVSALGVGKFGKEDA